MTFVFHIKGKNEYKECNLTVNENKQLSSNLERMRMEIVKLLNDDREKALHANVFKYLIPLKDEKMKSDDDTNDADMDDVDDSIKPLIDSEIVEYMKKEIKSLEICDVNGFETLDYNKIDIMTMDGKAYVINPTNLNTVKFAEFIDAISVLYSDSWLIKCAIDDCYTERVVLICSGKNDVHGLPKHLLPIYREELINFLYAIYSKALFVLKSTDEEFKMIVSAAARILNVVKLF